MDCLPELKILLVEDDDCDALLIEARLRLECAAYTLRRVQTRQAFLEQLDAFDPDLIISDVYLPEFHGMEALQLTRARNAGIPFIVTSGSNQIGLGTEARRNGADAFLPKSELHRLPKLLRQVLAHDRQSMADRRVTLRD